MSDDEDALLATIRHAREDDEQPYLVYADWCDENGKPELAELIRLETRLDREGRKNDTRFKPGGAIDAEPWYRHFQLKQNERAIYDEVRAVVGFGPVLCDYEYDQAFPGGSHVVYVTRRGLPSELRGYLSAFLELAGPVFARFPIRHVRLHDRSPAENEARARHDLARFVWIRDERTDLPHYLPRQVFEFLLQGAYKVRGPDWVGYQQWDVARDELDRALVCVGHRLARQYLARKPAAVC